MKIGVIIGSDSDLPVLDRAFKVWDEFEIPYEVDIISAHRSPQFAAEYAGSAEERGVSVIVAAAGLAAHLPGVIAAQTVLPVIGLPIAGGALSGVDALYSIVQMPPGIPVASVGVDNSTNAAFLALQILALIDDTVRQRLVEYRRGLPEKIKAKNLQLRERGFPGYIE